MERIRMKFRFSWLNPLLLLVFLALLCGGLYPLLVTLLAQSLFPVRANGSLIRMHGRVAGSMLLAQEFKASGYFQTRPSVCNTVAVPSGASNSAPTSAVLRDSIVQRHVRFLAENGLDPNTVVPSEMLCASGSGLDPHISPEAALLQVGRIAGQRHLNTVQKMALVDWVARMTESRQWGIFGKPRVNVLGLNLVLDTAAVFRKLK